MTRTGTRASPLETETLPAPPPLCGAVLRYRAKAAFDTETPGLDAGGWAFDELLSLAGLQGEDRAAFAESGDLAVHPGGWQSWSAGWELIGRERLPRKVALIPELKKLTHRDGETPPSGSGWITGHFIVYLRAGDRYLCLASNEGDGLAPLTFYIHRERRQVRMEVFAPGKEWKAGETAAGLTVLYACGFFAFKDALKALYRQEDAFRAVDFLRWHGESGEAHSKRNLPGGYQSWYNHYTNIHEALILEDLQALAATENLLKLRYIDRGRPLVFQIDDGWQRAVGEWEIHTGRFPRGLECIAGKIEAEGFIPGLWLAPFLVTRRSRIFREKPEWLLRQAAGGEPVVAGFNHLWDKRYYCLDISRPDVKEYLKDLIDRAIDEWGFRYLKLDFLYAGLFAGAFAEKGAPHEHYERALAILTSRKRNAAGLSVAYLGCGLPLGPSYRHLPLSRTGADTRETWDWHAPRLLGHVGRPSAKINLLDTIGRTHLDGAVYLSDPDVIFLRSKNCKLKENEKELVALVNFLLAGQIMFSDDPLHLTPADVALTRRINALYEKLENDEYGAVRICRDVFRVESRRAGAVGLVNLNSRPFRLERGREPELFLALSAATLLVDRRLGRSAGSVTFAGRSISLAVI
ncbi:MAG: alpha-galactosidase [Treponema sp.]|nr:alpha-galactosidase [Treponema sp.]